MAYSKRNFYSIELVRKEHYLPIWRMFKMGMQFEEVCMAYGINYTEEYDVNDLKGLDLIAQLIDEVCDKDFEGTRIFLEGENVL